MSDESQSNVIALLTSDNAAEREQGLALAANETIVTIDGSSLPTLAGANLLGLFPKLTSVTLTVGEHTEEHITTLVHYLQRTGVASETIRVSGKFGGPEWLTARDYSWTKYFDVEELSEYIQEIETGRSLYFSLGEFTSQTIAEHEALTSFLQKLRIGHLKEDPISISRSNAGGYIYSCSDSMFKTVQYFWEDMSENSSEFDCDDHDEWEKFVALIDEQGLSLTMGFFDNEMPCTQAEQESWWIFDFDFPPAESIVLNWALEV